jgi:hypothetical protein
MRRWQAIFLAGRLVASEMYPNTGKRANSLFGRWTMIRLFTLVAFVGAVLFAGVLPLAAEEPTADDYLNFFKPFVGEWTVKYKLGDKTGECDFSLSLSSTKRCFAWQQGAMDEFPAVQSLDGYDGATKKWKSSAFDAAGDHWVTYYSTDAKSLKGTQATFEMDQTQTKLDGTVIRWRYKATFIMKPNEIKVIQTEQTRNGEKLPDFEFLNIRKK